MTFIVENDGSIDIYQAGIAMIENGKYDKLFCDLSEVQYVIKCNKNLIDYEIIDLQDPDMMRYEEISDMLIKKMRNK